MGPEFQLGQVYDGGLAGDTTGIILYRPVYGCVSSVRGHMNSNYAGVKSTTTNKNSAALVCQDVAQVSS